MSEALLLSIFTIEADRKPALSFAAKRTKRLKPFSFFQDEIVRSLNDYAFGWRTDLVTKKSRGMIDWRVNGGLPGRYRPKIERSKSILGHF